MGRGNYLPSSEMGDHRMVYVDGLLYGSRYDDLISTIRTSVPKSFYDEDAYRVHDCKVVARSYLLDVCVADNEWSTAVFIVPREGLDEYPSDMNLAYRHIDRISKKLFGKLAEMYTLRVRAGAWCSGPYTQ